jgi:putative ABC transport system permease protein
LTRRAPDRTVSVKRYSAASLSRGPRTIEFSDLRYALRSLKKSPGFVAAAVVSLGLGLGLVTTMFALIDAATHPYVPYRDADRLYAVRYWRSGTDQRFSSSWIFAALRDRTRVFETFLTVAMDQQRLGADAEAGDVTVARVPARLFAVLGVKPRLGRLLEGADAGRGTVLVSDPLWRRLFPGRRALAGATLALDGRVYAVAGVMPRGMTFPYGASVWLPLADSSEQTSSVTILTKLRPGVTREAANAQLLGLATYLTRTYHVERSPFAFYLSPLRDDPMKLRDVNYAMIGAALAVLLIACANLANLMLARGLAKRRELALRLAVGASRAAVARQMFLEAVPLTVAGAALGVALSLWGVQILQSRVPSELWWFGILRPQLSWRVFALAALAASGSAALFGLVPAIRVAREVNLDEPLKDGAGTTGRTRHRYSALVISEVGLALMLLMGAGLLLKVVHRLASYEFNFAARQLLRSGIYLRKPPGAPSVGDTTGAELLRLELGVIAALRTVPGVLDAAAHGGGRPPGLAVTAEMAGDSNQFLNLSGYDVVTPGYLRTMGLPALEGRDFLDGDLGGDGVVILNAAAAARLYPRQRVVGHMLKLGAPAAQAPWLPIVGVCRSLAEGPPGQDEFAPRVYVVQRPGSRRLADILIRTARDDPHIAEAVRARLKTLGPGVGTWVWPYLSWYEGQLRSQRFLAQLFTTMGAFALVLAAVGIYGVLAYAVNRRLREFAVRMALGAQRRDMLKLVLHDGLVMTLAGTGLGAFAALWASSLLATFLEDQRVLPTDVLTLILAEAVLIAMTMAACLAPALRAMRADPMEILRAT